MQDVLNEKLTLVSVNISVFSGYRRATREHIAALGGTLPTSAAITEGSIKVFPCDGTKDLQTTRRGLFRALQAKGIKALGSQNVFAVLTDELEEIEKEMADAEVNFGGHLTAFETSYEKIFEAHVARNPEAEKIIRSLKVDKMAAVSKCRFATSVFRITPFVREGESEEEGVEGIVRGLGRQLYEEVADEMNSLLKNEVFKKQRVGQKSLRPLKGVVEKMRKLAFLDQSFEGAIKLVTDTLDALPKQGYIEGQEFVTLERLVEVMAEADEVVNAASKVRNGIPVCEVLFPPAPVVKAQVVEAAPVVAEPAIVVTPPSVAKAVPLPTIPVPNMPAFSKGGAVGAPAVVRPPAVVQPAPVLKEKGALKPNALFF